MVADVGDPGSVGGPDGVFFVDVFVGGELVELFGGDVVEVKRAALVVAEIALDVLLEVIAVNDDGLGRGGGLALFGVGLGLGLDG